MRSATTTDIGPIVYRSCLESKWKAGREGSDRGLVVSPTEMSLLATRCLLGYETGEFAHGGIYMATPRGDAGIRAGRVVCMGRYYQVFKIMGCRL